MNNRDQSIVKQIRQIIPRRQETIRPPIELITEFPLCVSPEVYSLRDIYIGRKVKMSHIGLDIGTHTIVVSLRGEDNKVKFISEVNGYWLFERASSFVENMLNDPQKIRSDGTARPARWFKLEDSGKIVVIGRDAEELAYAKNDTLLRPMAEGGVAPEEEAMTVLSTLIQGLIGMAEHEFGEPTKKLNICYCTTAPAINKESNLDYHERVVEMILDGYETTAEKTINKIKESHAIVLNMSPDGTGIGISWGAGTVTVSYIKYGIEIYSFCWVGAGDWIDTQVAIRHGYTSKTFSNKSKETPTTISRRKMTIDLNHEQSDRIGRDIALHYDVLIEKVIEGIVKGFVSHESQARIEEGINIYMAGGTSSPKGFSQRVVKYLNDSQLPFKVGEVKRSSEPLYCVAEGCLKAAEIF